MNLLRRLALIFCTVVLVGCASQPLSQEQLQAIRSVGVVWLMPDQVTFQKLGVTVFGNEPSTFDMGEPLEPLVVRAVTDRVAGTRPKWSVRPVRYDAAALLRQARSGGLVFVSDVERIGPDLAGIASADGVDALLVFVPMRWDNAPYFGGEGLGVWRRALPGLDSPILHANFALHVVDGRGQVLASDVSIDRANPIRVAAPDYAREVPTDPQTAARLRADLRALALGNVRARAQALGF